MSLSNFHVRERVFDASHVRGYPRATRNEEDDVLKIHVKQYIPHSTARFEPYDVTFIAAHANGVSKEMYEPLFDELHAYARRTERFRIRSIWIADVAWQGQSSVLNEGKLGNDPNWFDHSRDLLLMINHFRKAMPRPLVGIGHSMGGCQIANLALIHPRVFASVLLIDPVIQHELNPRANMSPAQASTLRRDWWPSRQAAAEAFLRNPFYRSWDPRVFSLWMQHGLRDVPTETYPEAAAASSRGSHEGAPVTLTTTKHQEVFTFLRPLQYEGSEGSTLSRSTHADAFGTAPGAGADFYRPEPIQVFHALPQLWPSCLYIFAEHSDLSSAESRRLKMERTGKSTGGSGGVADGLVKEVVIAGAGHFVAFEKPAEVAAAMGQWLDVEMPRFRQLEAAEKQAWRRRRGTDQYQISAARLAKVKQDRDAAAKL